MKPHSLLALLCIPALASCEPDAASGTALNSEAAENLADLERDIQRARAEVLVLRDRVRTAAGDRDRLAGEHSSAEARIRDVAKEIDVLHEQFAAYKAEYRRAIQSRASGMELTGLTAGSRFYEKAKVSSLTDKEVALVIDSGIIRLPLADLAPDFQALFGYDPAFKAPGPPPLLAAPGSLAIDEAIAAGKRAAAENNRLLLEMGAARDRKKPQPPRYLRAPSSPGKRIQTSFEGSYWAPYNK